MSTFDGAMLWIGHSELLCFLMMPSAIVLIMNSFVKKSFTHMLPEVY